MNDQARAAATTNSSCSSITLHWTAKDEPFAPQLQRKKEKRFAPGSIRGAHAGRIVSARPCWEVPDRFLAADGHVCHIRKARSASGLRLIDGSQLKIRRTIILVLSFEYAICIKTLKRHSAYGYVKKHVKQLMPVQLPERQVTPGLVGPTLPASEGTSIDA